MTEAEPIIYDEAFSGISSKQKLRRLNKKMNDARAKAMQDYVSSKEHSKIDPFTAGWDSSTKNAEKAEKRTENVLSVTRFIVIYALFIAVGIMIGRVLG